MREDGSAVNRQEWRNERSSAERAKWGDGPWASEPDKIQWIDDATDLDCLIVRNRLGALCGYVGLPPGHPMHGKDYGDVRTADGDYPECNGGLTFAGACQPRTDPADGICHVPEPGRLEDIWWVGFDCAHAYDIVPGMNEYGIEHGSYKTVAWVERETSNLAEQLVSR